MLPGDSCQIVYRNREYLCRKRYQPIYTAPLQKVVIIIRSALDSLVFCFAAYFFSRWMDSSSRIYDLVFNCILTLK